MVGCNKLRGTDGVSTSDDKVSARITGSSSESVANPRLIGRTCGWRSVDNPVTIPSSNHHLLQRHVFTLQWPHPCRSQHKDNPSSLPTKCCDKASQQCQHQPAARLLQYHEPNHDRRAPCPSIVNTNSLKRNAAITRIPQPARRQHLMSTQSVEKDNSQRWPNFRF